MEYQDRVYGKFDIDEPVILELIRSAALERLKRIDQGGYGPFWIREKNLRDYERNRFTHSVGTYLLLRKYGAPLEEQIAGLIHDVSHTAFSHCTEYVLNVGNEYRQNYQDSIHDRFVMESEIPAILARNGFDIDRILCDDNFPLKEKKLPDLCADRIDYTLRDAMVFSELGAEGARYFLDKLEAREGAWFFRDEESAQRFARLFFTMNKTYYSDFASSRMFCAVSGFLKHALDKGYIVREDLETDDDFVVGRATTHLAEDEELRLLFERMENRIGATNNPDDYDMPLVCKSRVVDPYFLDGGELRRLSDAYPRWKEVMAEEMKPKKYFVKFER